MGRKLGSNGIKVATQSMGLILAVIGAQRLLDGWFGAVAQYGGTSA